MGAQNREDEILWELLGEGVGEGGLYLDIGANDPISCSISHKFYCSGWRGIAIEAQEGFGPRWAQERPGDTFVGCAVGSCEGEGTLFCAGQQSSLVYAQTQCSRVRIRTINSILEEHMGGTRFPGMSFASMDVEGYEEEVLRGWDLARWRPSFLCIEAIIPNTLTYVHDKWEPILLESGYELAATDLWNRYYKARGPDAPASFSFSET